jgi:hypothetical protein
MDIISLAIIQVNLALRLVLFSLFCWFGWLSFALLVGFCFVIVNLAYLSSFVPFYFAVLNGYHLPFWLASALS